MSRSSRRFTTLKMIKLVKTDVLGQWAELFTVYVVDLQRWRYQKCEVNLRGFIKNGLLSFTLTQFVKLILT